MKIIESYICGKRPDVSLCEDGFCFTPHYAAVVDGSTSKVEGRHGGREAMRLVCQALGSLRPDADKAEMLRHLTAALARHNTAESQFRAEYRLTCSAVIYTAQRNAVWMVGDCQWRANGITHTNPKSVDGVLTRIRCDAAHYLLQQGCTIDALRRHDLSRSAIHDALREQTNFQNDSNQHNPFRYAVLDGRPIDETLVKEFRIPADTHEIILASDGYPVLCNTLAATEEELQRLLTTDPLCINENPATKGWMEGNLSFDDRCYLRLSI